MENRIIAYQLYSAVKNGRAIMFGSLLDIESMEINRVRSTLNNMGLREETFVYIRNGSTIVLPTKADLAIGKTSRTIKLPSWSGSCELLCVETSPLHGVILCNSYSMQPYGYVAGYWVGDYADDTLGVLLKEAASHNINHPTLCRDGIEFRFTDYIRLSTMFMKKGW